MSNALDGIRSLQTVLAALGDAFRTQAGASDQAGAALGKTTASSRSAASVLAQLFTTLQQASGTLGGLVGPMQLVEDQLKGIRSAANSTTTAVKKLQDAITGLTTALSAQAQAGQTAGAALGGTTASGRTTASVIAQLFSTIQQTSAGFGTLQSQLASINSQFQTLGNGAARSAAGVSQVTSAVQAGASATQQTTTATNAFSASLGNINSNARSSTSVLSSMFGVITSGGSSFGNFFSRIASGTVLFTQFGLSLGRIASSIGSAASGFISASTTLETYTVQYQTLLGSLEAARQRIVDIQALNVKSPFELPDLIEADRILTTTGLRTERLLLNVSNAGAALGGTAEKLREIALATGRIASGQFGVGFERLRELSVATRKDLEGEGLKFDKQGAFVGSVDQAMEALNKVLEKRFNNAAELASQTFVGIQSNISDRFFALRSIFGAPIFEVAKRESQAFLDTINNPAFATAAGTLGAAVSAGLEVVSRAFQRVVQTIQGAVGIIQGVINQVGGSLGGFIGVILGTFAPLGQALDSLLSGDFQNALNLTGDFLGNLGDLILSVLGSLAGQLFTGGLNTIASYADGLISGAAQYVQEALNFITGLIASFLQGFSPPKEGPLSTIDTWFPRVLDAYLGSWSEADFGVLTDITNRISGELEAMVEQGQLTAKQAGDIVLGTNGNAGLTQLLAQTLDGIRQTGQINADGLAQIQSLLGSQGQALFDRISADLQSTVLDRRVKGLQAQIATLSNPEQTRQTEAALRNAQEAVRTARTSAQRRAALEQIAGIRNQQSAQDKAKTALQAQISALQTQKQLIADQLSGAEALQKLRERETQFLERIVKAEQDRDGGKTDDAAARAAEEYSYKIADNAGKLGILEKRLAGTEKNSVEYYKVLGDIYDLKKTIAREEAQATGEAEAERKKVFDEAQKAAEAAAKAARDYAFHTADSAGKLAILRGELAGVEEGSADYWRILGQIYDLEQSTSQDQAARLQKAKEAQDAYNFAIADTQGKLQIVKDKLAGVEEGSAEYYQLLGQQAALEGQLAQDAQARTDAEFQYNLAQADTAGKLDLLRGKLAGVKEGSLEYYQLKGQIGDLERTQATEQSRIAEQQQREADARSDAEFQYQLKLADTAGKIQLLKGKLATLTPGSPEYYQVLGQINDLEESLEKSTNKRGKASKDANGAGAAGLKGLADAASSAEKPLDAIKMAIDEGKKKFDAFTGAIQAGKDRLAEVRKQAQSVLETFSVTPAGNFLGDAFTFLRDNGREIIAVLFGLGAGLGTFVVLSAVTPIIVGFGAALAGLFVAFNPLVLVIPALAATVGLLAYAFTTNFGGIREKAQPILDSVAGSFARLKDGVSQALIVLEPTLGKIGELFKALAPIIGVSIALPILIISNFVSIVGKALPFIAGAFNSALDVLIVVFETLTNVVTGFSNIFTALFNGDLSGAFTAFSTLAADLVSGIIGIFGNLLLVGIRLIGALIAGIIGFFENLFDVLVGNSIVPDLVDRIIDLFTDLWNKGVELIGNLVEGVITFFGDLKTTVEESVRQFVENVKTKYEDVKTAIVEKVTYAKDEAIRLFNLAKGTIEGSITTFVTNVQTGFENIKTAITTKIEYAKDEAIRLFGELINPITESVTTFVDDIPKQIETLKTNALNWLDQLKTGAITYIGDLVRDFTTAVTNFTGDIEGKFGTFKTNVLNAIGAIPDGFSNLLTAFTNAASDLGGAIADGIVNGITAGAAKIASAAQAVLSSAVEAAKNFLNSSSPSKLTRDVIGKPFSQGIDGGIEGEQNNLMATTRGVLGNVVDSAQGFARAGRAALGGMFDIDAQAFNLEARNLLSGVQTELARPSFGVQLAAAGASAVQAAVTPAQLPPITFAPTINLYGKSNDELIEQMRAEMERQQNDFMRNLVRDLNLARSK